MASRNSRSAVLKKRESGKALGLIDRDIEGHGKNMVHEIDVFDGHIFRDRNAGGREIDNATHTGLDQIVGGTLGTLWRSSDDSDFDFKFADFFFQAPGADNLQTGDFLANLEGIAIERADEDESAAPKNSVAQQGPAKIAHPDQRDIPGPVDPQRLLDGGQEILDIIPDASHAEFTEVREILPNLRRIHTTSASQSVRGYDRIPFLEQRLQNLDVDSQALNCGARYMGAFQNISNKNLSLYFTEMPKKGGRLGLPPFSDRS